MKISDLYVRLGLKSRDYEQGIDKAQKKTNAFSKGIKQIGGFIAGAFAVTQITSFTKELVQLGGVAQGVRSAFNRIADDQVLQDLKDATRGTVSELELMKRAVSAQNLGLPVENLASLFEFATKRAQDTGESVDYLVNSIVTGIGRKSPLILDNLGISAVQLREKLKGVGIQSASTADVAAAVGEIAAESMKNSGEIIDTTAVKTQQLTAAWRDLKTEFGESEEIQKGAASTLNVLTWYVKNFSKVIDDWKEWSRITTAIMTGGLSLFWQKQKKDLSEYESGLDDMAASSKAALDLYAINQKKANKVDEEKVRTIGDLRQKIADLKDSIDEYGISQTSQIQRTLKEIETAEKLLDTLTSLNKARQEVAPMPAMTGQAGTPQIAGEAPLPGGLANMSGFLERNASLTKQYTDEMLADWNNFSSQLKMLAEDEIANSIAVVAESLGKLATGQINLKGFFNSVISQLGDFLKKIGKMFILYGVAQSAFFKSLAAGPAGAATLIAAGAALVAIGGAIGGIGQQAASGNLSGSQSQGIIIKDVNAFDQQQQQLVAKVSGRDLEFVLSKRNNFKS